MSDHPPRPPITSPKPLSPPSIAPKPDQYVLSPKPLGAAVPFKEPRQQQLQSVSGVDKIVNSETSAGLQSSNQLALESSALVCSACGKKLEGEFVSALGQSKHVECFVCVDCNDVVATRFFPYEISPGNQIPLCEKDYFKRLDLLCSKCNTPLRGSYITAVGKKFHLEHFTCSMCDTVFGPEETYYEHGGDIFCHHHYSLHHAVTCAGCGNGILKQFLEIKQNGEEQWHPECYMIFKSWNVRMQNPSSKNKAADAATLRKAQHDMEYRVNIIWQNLSTFEESAAACISDMLLQVSNNDYKGAVEEAQKFIGHVEVLFSGIDSLDRQLNTHGDSSGLIHNKEPKILSKKIVNFFSVLSHDQDKPGRQFANTQELLALVTSLAQCLKAMIRIALQAALKLEQRYDSKDSVTQLLDTLASVETVNQQSLKSSETKEYTIMSDLCHYCRDTVEDSCIRINEKRWHKKCFKCSSCQKTLLSTEKEPINSVFSENQLLCKDVCGLNKQGESNPENVTQLEQYTFLLKVALKRLKILLKTDVQGPNPNQSSPIMSPPTNNRPPSESLHRANSRSKSFSSSHPGKNLSDMLSQRPTTRSPSIASDTSQPLPIPPNSLPGKYLAATPQSINGAATPTNSRRRKYLSEVSALEAFVCRQSAIQKLHPLLKDFFTLEELVSLINGRKQTFMSKLLAGLIPVKKASKSKDGTFGIPLEDLVQRNGVDSRLGSGPGRIRIPAIVDQSINALKTMDLRCEGIFRKNGNIKRLKQHQEQMDIDPFDVNLYEENPIQIAALLKKFLRDMPDPLLTFKLQPIFLASQRLRKEEDQKQVLRLACCLLPKPNRDLLEVLFIFLKEVANFADEQDGLPGNKMDLSNLATVIAPNILYSKGKDPIKDESFLAIDAIRTMLVNQDDMWTLPDDIAEELTPSLQFSSQFAGTLFRSEVGNSPYLSSTISSLSVASPSSFSTSIGPGDIPTPNPNPIKHSLSLRKSHSAKEVSVRPSDSDEKTEKKSTAPPFP